jgi:VanZ family protein
MNISEFFINAFNAINQLWWKQIDFIIFTIWLDKFFHATLMFILSLCIYYILRIKNFIYITLIITFIWIFKECIDLYIRETYFSINDIIANTAGMILAVLLIKFFTKK